MIELMEKMDEESERKRKNQNSPKFGQEEEEKKENFIDQLEDISRIEKSVKKPSSTLNQVD